MKKLSLAIIFAYCTLAVAAQEGFRVDYQDPRPSMLKYRKKVVLEFIISQKMIIFATN
jgi:hypothetical protein